MKRADIRVELLSNPRLLGSVRGLIRGYVSSLGLSREKTDDVVLALDEACANSIRHSYGGQPDQQVSLSCFSDNGFIEFVVCDEGIPAAADRLEPKSTGPADIHTLTPGGLGLQLMRSVFDEVEFMPGDGRGNKVVLRLRRPRPE